MAALRVILTIVFLIVCVLFVVLVLSQEGKDAGLGTIGGIGETYWSKIRGRTAEGTRDKLTVLLAVLFFALAIILNLNF
ncbi:MAG: preprotein translocase subunit SecG [Lachnospiraceae bacterium]